MMLNREALESKLLKHFLSLENTSSFLFLRLIPCISLTEMPDDMSFEGHVSKSSKEPRSEQPTPQSWSRHHFLSQGHL